MTEESTNANPTGSETPSVTPTPTPPAPNPQPTHTPSAGPQENPLKALVDALDALPEKVASAVGERFPKQHTPKVQKNDANDASSKSADSSASTTNTIQPQSSPTNTPGKKKSFGEWWFHG